MKKTTLLFGLLSLLFLFSIMPQFLEENGGNVEARGPGLYYWMQYQYYLQQQALNQPMMVCQANSESGMSDCS